MKFVTDTGWMCSHGCNHIRGWCTQERMVRIAAGGTTEEFDAWFKRERAKWIGQVLGYKPRPDGSLYLHRSVDSGD